MRAAAAFVALLAVVLTLALVTHLYDDYFPATDDQGVELIETLRPDYQPWAAELIDPERIGGEELLFALQGLAGLGMIGAAWVWLRRRAAASD